MLLRFSLLAGLLFVAQTAVFASDLIAKDSGYHIETHFSKRARADYHITITSPETTTGKLKEYALVPPETETQKLVECNISCREYPNLTVSVVGDEHDPSRKYKMIEIPVNGGVLAQPLHIDITYVVDMFKSLLKPGTGPTQVLDEGEKARALAETPLVDYHNPQFQAYLRRNDLLKRDNESNLNFAYRAYHILAQEISARTVDGSLPDKNYIFKTSYVTGSTCKVGGCGNCSITFTGVMRANGIPSRLLVGRWALSQEDKDYGQWHVRSDFFDPSVGWVLVDQTFAAMGVHAHDAHAYDNFGGDNTDFFTMHTNSEVHPLGSNFEMPVHQFGVTSYFGSAPYKPKFTETWIVSRIQTHIQQGMVENFDDFENGYKNWQFEGEAFGNTPASGTLSHQQCVLGYNNQHLINTFLAGDAAQGEAVSRYFTIAHRYIRFLIGGGQDSDRLALQLIVDGKTVCSATGKNSEELDEGEWDVSSYIGKQAYFRIIDLSSDGWGHILVDDIGFADKPMTQN